MSQPASLRRSWITLARSTRGGTAVEFALLAPVFLGFLFSIIEGGRLLWMKQSLNEVAYSTVRCKSVSASCASLPLTKTYAVARAARYRIRLPAGNITATGPVTCDNNASSNKVTLTTPFNSPLIGMLPFIPANVVAHACFANLS